MDMGSEIRDAVENIRIRENIPEPQYCYLCSENITRSKEKIFQFLFENEVLILSHRTDFYNHHEPFLLVWRVMTTFLDI
jgi:hypothetical protein